MFFHKKKKEDNFEFEIPLVQNGKVVCSICLKESYEEDNQGNKLLEVSQKSILATHNKITKKKSVISLPEFAKNINERENIAINEDKNFMINPCRCDKVMHPQCMIKYCIFNVTLQCKTCSKIFDFIDLQNNDQIKPFDFQCFLNSVIVLIIIVGLIVALSFINWGNMNSKYFFWNYIFGIIIIIVLLYFCYFEVCFISELMRKKINNLTFVKDLLNKEIDDELMKEKYNKFTDYYSTIFSKKTMNLIDDKYNSKLYSSIVILENNKLAKYIYLLGVKSVNNKISDEIPISNKNNIKLKENELPENIINQASNNPLIKNTYNNSQQFLKKQASFQANNIVPVDKNANLVRSRTKKSSATSKKQNEKEKEKKEDVNNSEIKNLNDTSKRNIGDNINSEANLIEKSNKIEITMKQNSKEFLNKAPTLKKIADLEMNKLNNEKLPQKPNEGEVDKLLMGSKKNSQEFK